MKRLTVKEIEAKGWLKRQLEIQAKGLSGNLHKIWPDVRDSKWIGGDREGWERVPYWLDGFIPLAYLLKDEEMIAVAGRYIDKILAGQQKDGWLCPCTEEERGRYDVWALFLILKVLVVYYECSGDGRIEEAVYRALFQYRDFLRNYTPAFWGGERWYECLVSLLWLYERRPEKWILEIAQILKISGMDFASAGALWKKVDKKWTVYTHVVNIAMSLKSGPLYRRVMNKKEEPVNDSDAERMFRLLEKYHGTATGHFNGDECLSGTSPIHGTELCGIAEAMYSYEWLMSLTEKSVWGDRLERLAFNALPAAISPDMWTHQYDQQTNQIECSRQNEPSVFNTNSPDAHIFGLEPNFGCCTANFNQAWPKFALSAFMLKGRDTIVSAVLVPASVSLYIGASPVRVTLDTEYPFREKLVYTVEADAEFSLKIRIPSWVKGFTVNGKEATAENGWLIVRKKWKGRETLNVEFRFETELVRRPRDLYVLKRGALVYSLAIDERWEKREYVSDGVERKFPYCDYEVYPESKWNYGFEGGTFEIRENTFDSPFSTENPPIEILADMSEIDWGYAPGQTGVCRETPKSRKPKGKTEKKVFKPYGCTNLRMTEMPVIKK